jgi:hypothetical protein
MRALAARDLDRGDTRALPALLLAKGTPPARLGLVPTSPSRDAQPMPASNG